MDPFISSIISYKQKYSSNFELTNLFNVDYSRYLNRGEYFITVATIAITALKYRFTKKL